MPVSATPKNYAAPADGKKLLMRFYRLSTFLLAAAFLSAFVEIGIKSDSNWPEALLLLLATAGTLIALARQLPSQNVLLAAGIIALIGGMAHLLGARSGIPFGPFIFGTQIGWKIFNTLPWAMPLLWIVVILNSRGVARLILRPWRKIRTYGFWLIGLTALLTMLFDCALEPFAAHTKHYWLWSAKSLSLMPHGAPPANSVGWFLVTVLILAFATPAMINKQLSKRSVPDFQPLAVWLGCILLFGVAAALDGLWMATAVDAAMGIVTTVFAVRGGRW
jgi:uncharacterized membrane protein